MTVLFQTRLSQRPNRRALTLVEATISVVIVGVLLVAALNATGAALATRRKTADRRQGVLLAQDLMSEILQQHYEDPDASPGSFGLDAAEVGDGSRALFDDVDDYSGWSASPPQQRNGTPLSNFSGWGRSAEVSWVMPSDFAVGAISNTGVKQVTVTVTHDDVTVAELVAVRTDTWPEVSEYRVGGDVGDGAGTPGNNAPDAVASAVPETGTAPLGVSFSADGSSDPDGDPLTYHWDFGDGQTGSGVTTAHTFSQGSYVVTLTVSDGRGGTDTDTVGIKASGISVIK